MTTAYRYDASKGRFSGVPARDITAEQFDAMGPREKRIVRLSGAYTAVEPQKLLTNQTRDELDALALERGIDPTQHSTKASLIDALTEEG